MKHPRKCKVHPDTINSLTFYIPLPVQLQRSAKRMRVLRFYCSLVYSFTLGSCITLPLVWTNLGESWGLEDSFIWWCGIAVSCCVEAGHGGCGWLMRLWVVVGGSVNGWWWVEVLMSGGDVESCGLRVWSEFPLAEFANVLSRKVVRWLVCMT